MKVLFGIVTLILLGSCQHKWVAIPSAHNSFERCSDHSEFPQMIKIPELKLSYLIVDSCRTIDRYRISIAIETFINSWKDRFGSNTYATKVVIDNLNNLVITANNEAKIVKAYTSDGTLGDSLSVSGLALTKGFIWIKVFPGQRVCDTSLVHELVHVSIWSVKSTDGDPDHLGKRYYGWTTEHELLIQEVNNSLCVWGI
tara:strand:- start:3162 stop:3758 length:597 start_codon:yes stop_codon:yes gene_type:complete